MADRRTLGYALSILIVCAFPLEDQVLTPTVKPVPIPGGNTVPPACGAMRAGE